MILSDREIRLRAEKEDMIYPFHPEQVTHIEGIKVISFGLSSYGYDIRLADEFKIFTNTTGAIVDPKNFDENLLISKRGEHVDIPPNSYVLGHSMETIKVPRDLLMICLGKSTYARCGIITNVTPLEPEWEGYITLEIANCTPCPARIYAGEGIMQLIFLRALDVCEVSYNDKERKYQGQKGITMAKV